MRLPWCSGAGRPAICPTDLFRKGRWSHAAAGSGGFERATLADRGRRSLHAFAQESQARTVPRMMRGGHGGSRKCHPLILPEHGPCRSAAGARSKRRRVASARFGRRGVGTDGSTCLRPRSWPPAGGMIRPSAPETPKGSRAGLVHAGPTRGPEEGCQPGLARGARRRAPYTPSWVGASPEDSYQSATAEAATFVATW